jgi:hypothetical protein
MKIKIWIMTVDEENGLQSRLFTTEQARDAAIWDWLVEFNEDEEMTPDQLREKYKGDYALAYEQEFQVPMASCYMNWDDQEFEIDVPTPAPIGITLEGGVIQSIFSPKPELCPTVYVIDYDTDGADESELVQVPQDDGSTIAAFVTDDRTTKSQSVEWFAALDAAINEAQAK